ncbi:MAG: sodium:calcium symporter [Limisphaerales bacterium]
MRTFVQFLEQAGPWTPGVFLLVFVLASLLMIWRLEAMSADGFEGTVLGTLVMPYCSGIGNLVFAFLLGTRGGPGGEVVINALVNNVTNLTLLVGLPAVLWGLSLNGKVGGKGRRGAGRAAQVNRLSLLLTLTAVLFFSGAAWALARDGALSFNDGLVLCGLFLFWQCFHVFDVLKTNARSGRSFSWWLPVDLLLLAVGAVGVYVSTDWLVTWISGLEHGFLSARHLGWLTGWLMVLPNALLALYYGWRRRADVLFSSQVGDGHICIPLCLGIVALYQPVQVPGVFETGMLLLGGVTVLHLALVAVFGGVPRMVGLGLLAAYGWFVARGFGG